MSRDVPAGSGLDLAMLNALIHDLNEELTILVNVVGRLKEIVSEEEKEIWVDLEAAERAVGSLKGKSEMVMLFLGERDARGWGNKVENVMEIQKWQEARR